MYSFDKLILFSLLKNKNILKKLFNSKELVNKFIQFKLFIKVTLKIMIIILINKNNNLFFILILKSSLEAILDT